MIEVGVPFSDPLADGPVIQRAVERALASGTTLKRTLEMIRRSRASVRPPLVLFTYVNPIVRMGEAEFVRAAAEAGIDGVLVLDLPVEEAGPFRQRLIDAGIDPIFLLSPTTTDSRIQQSADLGRGFLYVISRLGVTGVRDRVADGCRGSGSANPEAVAAAAGDGIRHLDARTGGAGRALGRRRRRGQRAGERDCRARERRRFAGPRGGIRPLAERSRMSGDLEDLRRRIDLLDEHLVRLLNARAACALEIGRLKREKGIDIYQPAREGEVLSHVANVNTGPLDTPAVRRLFERIIDEARRLERLADEAQSQEPSGGTIE